MPNALMSRLCAPNNGYNAADEPHVRYEWADMRLTGLYAANMHHVC